MQFTLQSQKKLNELRPDNGANQAVQRTAPRSDA